MKKYVCVYIYEYTPVEPHKHTLLHILYSVKGLLIFRATLKDTTSIQFIHPLNTRAAQSLLRKRVASYLTIKKKKKCKRRIISIGQ